MKIEIPNINDYESVNELAIQVHELHVVWRPDLFLETKIVIPKERYVSQIENKEIYIAKIDEKVVGYISFGIVEKSNPIMRYRKQLNIDAICVDEMYRGQGIGRALFEHIKIVAKENDCTDIYLTVNEENKYAIKAYEKFGMRVKNIAYSMEIN